MSSGASEVFEAGARLHWFCGANLFRPFRAIHLAFWTQGLRLGLHSRVAVRLIAAAGRRWKQHGSNKDL
jgi:hypothetical protein